MKRKHLIVVLLVLSALILGACGNGAPNRSISIVDSPKDVYVEDQIVFVAQVERLTKFASKKDAVLWSSSDESIAEIDETGTAVFKTAGDVEISAVLADDERVAASVPVHVLQPVKSISLDEEKVLLLTGSAKADHALNLTVSPDNAYTREAVWASSDEKVVKVDDNGALHAVGAGKASVSVKSADAHCAQELRVEVEVRVGVSELVLEPESGQVMMGKTLELSASVFPEDAENKEVLWSSSDESIATVDENGVITSVAPGDVLIHCAATDGSEIEADAAITVVQPIKSIRAEKSKLVITEKKTAAIVLKIEPEDANVRDMVWESSDESIASVSSTGEVTALRAGKCTVSATTTDGSAKTVKVSIVVEPYIPVDAVTFTRSGYFGTYSEFYVTFKNLTSTRAITGISFSVTYSTGYGSSYTANCYFSDEYIGAGSSRKIGAWNEPYLSYGSGFRLYLNSVTFSDGSTQYFSKEFISSFG